MLTCQKNLSVHLPNEILESIFKLLPPEGLAVCGCVCTVWKNVADQEKLWSAFITEKQRTEGLKSKQIIIDQNKSRFFSVFSQELISALGGIEKVKDLPFLNFNKPRILANGIIRLSELKSPLTVGRISGETKNIPLDRYSFLAIRFINREFDPKCTEKDVNIWITKQGYWTLLSGGDVSGWPTRFPLEKGCGDDFSKTVEYISRLVKGEPCGVRDIGSSIEHSKITSLGTSTISLA